jgi:hypothetical protein
MPHHPPKVFPDIATCRVKEAFDSYYYCLSSWCSRCPHTVSFGSRSFCRHPTVREILARSEDKKDKPA